MPIDVTVENHIAVGAPNRPEAMNAFDPEMREALYGLWDRVQNDDDVRVLIITGAGDKAFCTGSDLRKTDPPKESYAELLVGRNNPGNMLHKFGTDKPVICAVNGYAVGGGMGYSRSRATSVSPRRMRRAGADRSEDRQHSGVQVACSACRARSARATRC